MRWLSLPLSAALLLGAAIDGAGPLHRAAFDDDLPAAERAVRGGADVNGVNRYGMTPLSLACTNGNAAMVALLLKSGADANKPLPGGETPLMTCARTGKPAAVAALLAAKADVSAKESKGQTAIMWAAAEGNVEAVKLLIAGGAEFRERVPSGFTPFLFAVREGRSGAVSALLKAGVDVNESILRPGQGRKSSQGRGWPPVGNSALVLAVLNGHFELASQLLDAGADPNAAGAGYTALHAISHVRKSGGGDNDPPPIGSGAMTSLQFVGKLAAKGANLNARMTQKVGFGLTRLNTMSATPFLLAAKTADVDLMRELAKLGADARIPNADDSTPLMAAAGLGTRSPGEDAGTEEEVVAAIKLALELGNDIDAVDKNGETAMHGAAYKNLPEAVRLLAARGANFAVWNQPNKFGWTPLTIAEGYRFGNFKPSVVTVAAFLEVFTKAGVEPARSVTKGKTIY